MIENEELLTYEELSERVKLKVVTLRNLKIKGMPCLMIGGTPRFYLSEVISYFNKSEEGR